MTAPHSAMSAIHIALLADHPEALPLLQRCFEAEWPAWYGPEGPGDAAADLRASAQRDGLPLALVARQGGAVVGIALLREEDAARARLPVGPWVGGGFVLPERRGGGIGAMLLAGLEAQARRLGFATLYCSTHTADRLLQREGWERIEQFLHDGEPLTVYRKALAG